MKESSSVSQWIIGLKAGQAAAAQHLWDRYSDRLVTVARQRLGDAPRRVADEEDVAQSVFFAICRGADAGRLSDIRHRDDLWWLLLGITRMKVADHVRRETAQKRGAGRVRAESDMYGTADQSQAFSLDDLIGEDATPEMVVMLEEQHTRLLALLRDKVLRKIATARIEGYTIPEIAKDLSISTRSIERKLKLIRIQWAQELNDGQ